jgi:hypothetical protein
MRKFFLFICLLSLFSCSKQELQKPDFLLGYWNRVNNQPEKKTYEIWRSDFTGIGYTLKGKDTTFVEILSIVEINNTLFYKVVGVNENPTLFKFTEQTETSFTCENPENEFPKKIQYSLENGVLKAMISAGNDSIEFVFEKDN